MKNLQFRLVVKLADKPLNFEMLTTIANTYGGFVRQINCSQIGQDKTKFVQ
jgi:hypothetical protein